MKKSLVVIIVYIFVLFQVNIVSAQYIPKNLDRKTLSKAVDLYKDVLKKDKNVTVELELAEVLYLLGRYQESAKHYGACIRFEDILPIHYKIYSIVLSKLGRGDSARYYEQKYNKHELEASLLTKDLQLMLGFSHDTISYFVNRAPFNSHDADFSPIILDTSLIFVSTRKHSNDLNLHPVTGESYYDFYKVNFLPEGKFTAPQKLVFDNFDHDVAEGPISISADKRTIYFNRNYLDAHSMSMPEKNLGDKHHIMYGRLDGNKISDIKNFEYIDMNYSCAHPYITRDGQELIFAANDPEGSGGFDLFVCKKAPDGRWRKPENLGRTINTEKDELYPFLDQNENLYFASDGHLGLGGLDIFMSHRTPHGWSEPVNLGTPFNSHYDDFGVYFKRDLKSGYFSSNRPDGEGSDDIYYFERIFDDVKDKQTSAERLLTKINQNTFKEQKGLEFKGKLTDKTTGLPMEDTWIVLMDQYKNEVRQAVTDERGEYQFKFVQPGNYLMLLEEKNPKVKNEFKSFPADTVYTFTAQEAEQRNLAELMVDPNKVGTKNIFLGVFTGDGANFAGKNIFLVDETGQVRNHTEVNKEGFFGFKNLKNMKYYLMSPENIDKNQLITYMCNQDSGLVIAKKEFVEKEKQYDESYPANAEKVNVFVAGTIQSEKNKRQIGQIDVFLVSSNLKHIQISQSNALGYFVFHKPAPLKSLLLNEASQRSLMAKRYVTLDYNLDPHLIHPDRIKALVNIKGGIERGETFVVNGRVSHIQGTSHTLSQPLLVLDSTNNIITRVRSNTLGYFVINKLSYKNHYKVVFENYEPHLTLNTHLTYIDHDLQEFYGKSSSYKYAELKGIKVESKEINLNAKAFHNKSGLPVDGLAFFIVGENDQIIQRLATNKDGSFYYFDKKPGNYFIIQEQPDTSITLTVNSNRKSYSKLKNNIEIAGSKNFQLFNSVYFGLGDSELNDYAKNVLNSFQSYMKVNKIRKVVLNGYGDLTGTVEKNLIITTKRTNACKEFLDFKGIDLKKIELKALGKTDQFKNEKNEYDPALNRKVDILFLE